MSLRLRRGGGASDGAEAAADEADGGGAEPALALALDAGEEEEAKTEEDEEGEGEGGAGAVVEEAEEAEAAAEAEGAVAVVVVAGAVKAPESLAGGAASAEAEAEAETEADADAEAEGSECAASFAARAVAATHAGQYHLLHTFKYKDNQVYNPNERGRKKGLRACSGVCVPSGQHIDSHTLLVVPEAAVIAHRYEQKARCEKAATHSRQSTHNTTQHSTDRVGWFWWSRASRM